MSPSAAISVFNLAHSYGTRPALQGISFDVAAGEVFGLLGPNGGGKTTLFRILSTLLPVQSGTVTLLGRDVARAPAATRARIGVTFQSSSLDRKLTVRENLKHQGHLYGLAGRDLSGRIDRLLDRFALADRANDRSESLSGGLARRVEIAKGLIHEPQVLLLDEPSTGLDPGARLDLWQYLTALRDQSGVTILITTHILEEAEQCDRLAILDTGRLVALGTPGELRSSIGGDCLTIETADPVNLARQISDRFGIRSRRIGSQLRIETPRGHEFVSRLVEELGSDIASVALGKPTLEDVFVERTGHRFWQETQA